MLPCSSTDRSYRPPNNSEFTPSSKRQRTATSLSSNPLQTSSLPILDDSGFTCARTLPRPIPKTADFQHIIDLFFKENFVPHRYSLKLVPLNKQFDFSMIKAVIEEDKKQAYKLISQLIVQLISDKTKESDLPCAGYQLLQLAIANKVPRAETLLRFHEQKGFGVSTRDLLSLDIDHSSFPPTYNCSFKSPGRDNPYFYATHYDALKNLLRVALTIKSHRITPCSRFSNGTEDLALALYYNTTLTQLYVDSTNAISPIFSLLATNPTLRSLTLKGITNIPSFRTVDFSALGINTSLTHLNITEISIEDMNLDKFAKALQKNSSLQNLRLHNVFDSPDFENALCSFIRQNTSLSVLDISNNNLSIGAGRRLEEALRENQNITELNLNHCRLIKKDTPFLCELILKTQSLTSLDLGSNYFNSASLIGLATALEGNTSLVSFNVENQFPYKLGLNAQHPITPEVLEAFYNALIKHPNLIYLTLERTLLYPKFDLLLNNRQNVGRTLMQTLLDTDILDDF